MSNANKGFGSMDKDKVKEIASKGGQSGSHNKDYNTKNAKENNKDHDGRKDNGGHDTSKNHK